MAANKSGAWSAGRVIALILTGLATLWVVGVALYLLSDSTSTVELVVVVVQAVIAVAIDAYALWRILTRWATSTVLARLGVVVLGVIVAPVALAVGIVGAVVAAVIAAVVAVVSSGASRTPVGSGPAAHVPSSAGASWEPPKSKEKCAQCVDGRQTCPECGGRRYRVENGAPAGNCRTCYGEGTVRCEACHGTGYKPSPWL